MSGSTPDALPLRPKKAPGKQGPATVDVSAIIRLERLFRQIKPHTKKSHKSSVKSVADLDRVTKAILALRAPIAEAKRQGVFADPWAAVRIGRDEVRTARVLAWFLDPGGSHGGGDVFVKSLWYEAQAQLQFGFELGRVDSAVTENWPSGDRQSRIDIAVEGDDCLVFVEIKIDARPEKEQLERYVKAMRLKAELGGKSNSALLFVCDASFFSIDGCLQISWTIVSRSLRRAARQLAKTSFSVQLASRFASHLDHFQ